MKSGGPWNLRGLRLEAREAARTAARRSGMSVGEWLNSVIKPADTEDREFAPPAGFDRDADDSRRQSFGSADRQRGGLRDDADRRGRDRRPDDRLGGNFHSEQHEQDRRPRDASWRERRSDDQSRQSLRSDEREQNRRQPDATRPSQNRRWDDQWRPSFGSDDREPSGPDANTHERERPAEDRRHPIFHSEQRDHDARPRDADWRGPGGESEEQLRLNLRNDERQWRRRIDENLRGRDRVAEAEPPVRRESSPYREERRGEAAARSLPEPDRFDEQIGHRPPQDDRQSNRQDNRKVSFDQAVAEITARQRVLDSEAAAAIKTRQRELTNLAADLERQPDDFSGYAETDRFVEAETAPEPAFTRPQPPPILPRQDVFDEPAAETAFTAQPPPLRLGEESVSAWNAAPQSENSPAPALDLSGLQQQLRQLTARIEALRPASDLEAAINGLRAELAEIGRSLTEALPQRAVESLEMEIRALAQRIDHGRQSGVDATALAGLERGLADVREALRGLTPAESLVGFNETVRALAKKIDVVSAKDDPAALQQLETAIGALRGIVSHVASNDTLTKVAEDVRVLSAKVDELASSAASGHALSALENRIDLLATALNNSTAAGYAVPRELERLLAGLIEKLELVQLSHTDHTALAHLEDRIAMLVKRLDVSDARLGLLEGVERGLADLLVYIEQLRGANAGGEAVGRAKPAAVEAIEHEIAEIKQAGRLTQDSLEAVHGTVEHVVGRLAMIESDMRGGKVGSAPAEPLPAKEQTPTPPIEPAAMSATSVVPATPAEPEPASTWPAARQPIEPDLPPDHPLEPGSAAGRARQPLSAAERIAASEAIAGSKPPVIPDPGAGKPDFIAAARRAARAAAAAGPNDGGKKAGAEGPAQPKTLIERLRTLAVAGAVVVIVLGCFHMASRLFQDGGLAAPPHPQAEPPHVQTEPPSTVAPPQVERPSAPAMPVPKANPTNLPTLPLPLPKADAAQNPVAPPLANPTPATGGGAGQQSLLNDPAAPFAMAASMPAAADRAPADGSAAGWAPTPATDITGALPSFSPQHSPATAPAPALGDKLPVAIGGPALRAAALAGDASAAYEVAVRFADGRLVPANVEEAARWFERAAKKGLAPAQFRLGGLYEKGLGVKKDLIAARDLYRAAADQGHGKAMHNLAVLYAEGIDGAADYRTAAHWFRKAADHGITDSQYNLAVLYARGVGVEQNFAEAYKWFDLAAKDGDKDAAKKRDEVALHLDQQSLAAARSAAETWTPQPQPAAATTVKAPAAWELPANGSSAAKPKARTAKAPAADATKVD
jgi:localization factor PodJL